MVLREDCWYRNNCTVEDCTNCIRYVEMKYLMEHSGLSKNRQKPISLRASGCDIKSFDVLNSIRLDIVNFVNNGESLYIYSEHTGNGKTSWSIKLLLRYFDQIWAGNGFRQRGYFIHVPALLNQLKDFGDNSARKQLIKMLTTIDLVVWDDIASTKLSDYDIQQLLVLIDQRVADGLANIYTGNLTSHDALKNALGERLASRIWNISTLIEFKGKDRRSEW